MSYEKEDKELSNCTFVKTVLMLFVVLRHSVHFWTGNWFDRENVVYESFFLKYFSEFISNFHVYAFVLVSGYIFYYLKYEKGKYGKFIPFIKNKAKRLLVPYIFTCIIWIVPIELIFFDVNGLEILNEYSNK